MRLIDADKLHYCNEEIVDETGSSAKFKVVHSEDIESAPTIDAVPVIRCKDCKKSWPCGWSSTNGQLYQCEHFRYTVHQNDFCSYAEPVEKLVESVDSPGGANDDR